MEVLNIFSVPEHLINAVKPFYEHPTCMVAMNDTNSEWHSQEQGIRQGYPLSPYLFITPMQARMTVANRKADRTTPSNQDGGVAFEDPVYVDDTIPFGKTQNHSDEESDSYEESQTIKRGRLLRGKYGQHIGNLRYTTSV